MGLLVALSGIDGVGKSTQVKLLTDYLTKHGKTVNAGESMFSYHLLQPVIQLVRSQTGLPKASAVRINHQLVPKLWFIPAFLDIWLSYLCIIRPKLAKHDYLIADRFYPDMWANMIYYGYAPAWALPLVKLLPRANISLLLMADPAIILTREQEFPAEYYHAQHQLYSQLGQLLPYHIIDANDTLSQVHEQILAAITS